MREDHPRTLLPSSTVCPHVVGWYSSFIRPHISTAALWRLLPKLLLHYEQIIGSKFGRDL